MQPLLRQDRRAGPEVCEQRLKGKRGQGGSRESAPQAALSHHRALGMWRCVRTWESRSFAYPSSGNLGGECLTILEFKDFTNSSPSLFIHSLDKHLMPINCQACASYQIHKYKWKTPNLIFVQRHFSKT